MLWQFESFYEPCLHALFALTRHVPDFCFALHNFYFSLRCKELNMPSDIMSVCRFTAPSFIFPSLVPFIDIDDHKEIVHHHLQD